MMSEKQISILWREFELSIAVLRLVPPSTLITCVVCQGSAPEQCGCGGKQTAAEAITFLEFQFDILSK
jgi:hypothetical protein